MRPSKKQRVVDVYRPGSIIKVEVKNFMTYAQATIEPGPRLNLVLGPNGTGKSSLVCAICVGLAGGTKLLGRGEDVSSFVRRGSQEGEVTITLATSDPDHPKVIKRRIKMDNSSKWWIDGKDAIMKDVLVAVKELNVQLDNLCQFLPQDKVVEFARMKPVELLHATERAVGNALLAELHQRLIETRKELSTLDSHFESVDANLKRLKEENERSERNVQQIRQREALLAEIQIIKQKLPWQEYKEVKAKYDQEREQLNNSREQLRAAKVSQESQNAPLVAKKKKHDEATKKYKKIHVEYMKLASEIDRVDISKMIQDLIEKDENVQNIEKQAEERRSAIARLKQSVERIQRELDGLQAEVDEEPEESKRERERLTGLIREHAALSANVKAAQAEAQSDLTDVRDHRKRLEEQHRRVSNAKLQRIRNLDIMQRTDGKMMQAYQWLQQNNKKFKGKVLGPIAAEVDVPNPQHAAILEQHVANNTWAYFVVEYPEDQDMLIKLMEKDIGYKPMVACYSGNADHPLKRPQGCEEAPKYARYNITHTLDQVFTAPRLVKHVINDSSNIAAAYVGSAAASWEDFFKDNREIRVLWTPDAQYRRLYSNYNANAQSTQVNPLREVKLFKTDGGGDSENEKQRIEAEMEEKNRQEESLRQKLAELQTILKDRQDKKAEYENQKKKLDAAANAHRNKIIQLNTKLKAEQKQLEKKEKSRDPLADKPKLERELAKAYADVTAAAVAQLQKQAKKSILLIRQGNADLAQKELGDQMETMEKHTKEQQEAYRRYEALVQQFERQVKELKARAKEAQDKAQAEAPMTDDLREAFLLLPDDTRELQMLVDTKEAEANGFNITDPGALRRFNARLEEIHSGETELKELEEKRATARQRIETDKALWLPQLKDIVKTIDETFSVNFASVGTAGEVVLHEAPGDDFENYAIEIRVKFRASEELQTLDANRQSGGERSVSTIIYLVALQGVTVTPFRVVDEINQGMDPLNERKVFKQLVTAATKPNTPQCFLLTPKLLPDLPFSKEVTVLHIMNGPYIGPVAQGFTMDRIYGNRMPIGLVSA